MSALPPDAYLAAIVASSDDAIISKNLDGIVQTFNTAAERMFGYTAAEIVGKSILTLIPPERRDEEVVILSKLRRGERVDHFETKRLAKDGRIVDVSLTVSPVRDQNGTIIGASKIARDITARLETERMLREQTRILETLNATGRAIASGLDASALVQKVTDAATMLSGAEFGAFLEDVEGERGDVRRRRASSGAPGAAFEDLDRLRAMGLFRPTFRGEGPIRIDDVVADPRYAPSPPERGTSANELRVRSYLAVPVISSTGAVHGGIFLGSSRVGVFTKSSEDVVVGVAAQAATAIDNTSLYERVRTLAEERSQLLEAEKSARRETERVSLMKDEFLATLSHELRTPLNAILGWAQLLQHDPRPERISEGVVIVLRNAKVQARLIDDLLDMSRIISGKIRLDVQRVDVRDVVEAAMDSVRPSAEAKSIRLHVVLDPLAGPVWGDPNRLQQCVWNLLTNAIKFTPKKGRVHVSLAKVNSHVEISVADTGQGIESELLPHVFERFRQGDSSTTRTHGGLGLGLSIVKHLIELHGGTVDANSRGIGQGSTFRIALPRMVVEPLPPRADDRASPADGHDPASLKGLTVLVVDDEPDALRLMKRVLERCEADVILASDVDDALREVRARRPSIVVSDIGMPGRDGFDLIQSLRQLPLEDGRRTPAIALSAFARAEDRTRVLRAGYQAHVAKPVDVHEIVALIASLCSQA